MALPKIALMGDFNPNYEPHRKMNQFFEDEQIRFSYSFEWISTDSLANLSEETFHDFNGFLAGSGPYLNMSGILRGIRFARKNNIPFLGTCSGFGYSVLEIAQEIYGLEAVDHPHLKPDLEPKLRFLQPLSYCSPDIHPIYFNLINGTKAQKIYGKESLISENSHCAYGVHLDHLSNFSVFGFIPSGIDETGEPKIMEYNPNDFWFIMLFLPQFNTSLDNTHPLLKGFIEHSLENYRNEKHLSLKR